MWWLQVRAEADVARKAAAAVRAALRFICIPARNPMHPSSRLYASKVATLCITACVPEPSRLQPHAVHSLQTCLACCRCEASSMPREPRWGAGQRRSLQARRGLPTCRS